MTVYIIPIEQIPGRHIVENSETMNLTKRLSTFGAASRRKSAELIKTGHVTVNGTVETNPATQVGPKDRIRVDGAELNSAPKHYYIMLDKPRGYICTNDDPHAKKRALDLIHLRDSPRLFSCGRLDKDSEGLIIFTNDGDFAMKLSHPSSGILKSYALQAEKPFTPEQLQQMCDGVQSEGEDLHAEDIYQIGEHKYLIVLAEGKNREVRRMAEAFGNGVRRLERVAIGNLRRGMLKPGEWRFMNRRDMANLFGVDPDDPSLDAYQTGAPKEHGDSKPGFRKAHRDFKPGFRKEHRDFKPGFRKERGDSENGSPNEFKRKGAFHGRKTIHHS